MTLKDQGHRFVFRRGVYAWMPRPCMEPGDIDCTDMDDLEFETFVAVHN